MEHEQLYKNSNLLLEYNQELQKVFTTVLEQEQAADFFSVVKPFADKVRDVVVQWEENALLWVKKDKPKYFHKNQIDNIVENITTVSIQAFFPDTKEKRFKQLIRSNQYNLETIIQHLK